MAPDAPSTRQSHALPGPLARFRPSFLFAPCAARAACQGARRAGRLARLKTIRLDRPRGRRVVLHPKQNPKNIMSEEKSARQADRSPITNLAEARAWASARGVTEDRMPGPGPGGRRPRQDHALVQVLDDTAMALPSSIFMQTISAIPRRERGFVTTPQTGDLELRPDFAKPVRSALAPEPTAQVINDAFSITTAGRSRSRPPAAQAGDRPLPQARLGSPVWRRRSNSTSVKRNIDPDYPLEPPIGRSGPRRGRAAFLFDLGGQTEFDAVFEHLRLRRAQGLEVTPLIHEEGAAQMEINLRHGDPLPWPDQVFLFEAHHREPALAHDIYATFMAKADQPWSRLAMHVHQSVLSSETPGATCSTDPRGNRRRLLPLLSAVQATATCGGDLHAGAVRQFLRRLVKGASAPVNVAWGYDNRTTGLRIPPSSPTNRRVENRVLLGPTPILLALAASLPCGYFA